MSTSSPKEITASSESPRVLVIPEWGRMIISRPEAVIMVCLRCGGALPVILHVHHSKAWLPPLRECKCGGESKEGV